MRLLKDPTIGVRRRDVLIASVGVCHVAPRVHQVGWRQDPFDHVRLFDQRDQPVHVELLNHEHFRYLPSW
jgi:hypothetical protein